MIADTRVPLSVSTCFMGLIALRACSDWFNPYFSLPVGPFRLSVNQLLYALMLFLLLMLSLTSGKLRLSRAWLRSPVSKFLLGILSLQALGAVVAWLHFGGLAISASARILLPIAWIILLYFIIFHYLSVRDSLSLFRFIMVANIVTGLLDFGIAHSSTGYRLEGLFNMANSAGVYFALAANFLIMDERIFAPWLRYPLVFLLLAALVYTQSRSALILFGIMLILGSFILLSRPRKLVAIGLASCIAVAATIFASGVLSQRWAGIDLGNAPNYIRELVEVEYVKSENSLEWRLLNWAGLIRETMALSPYVGAGTGAEFIINPLRTHSATLIGDAYSGYNTHSWLVRLFVNTGLLGGLVYIALVSYLLVRGPPVVSWFFLSLSALAFFYHLPVPQAWITILLFMNMQDLGVQRPVLGPTKKRIALQKILNRETGSMVAMSFSPGPSQTV